MREFSWWSSFKYYNVRPKWLFVLPPSSSNRSHSNISKCSRFPILATYFIYARYYIKNNNRFRDFDFIRISQHWKKNQAILIVLLTYFIVVVLSRAVTAPIGNRCGRELEQEMNDGSNVICCVRFVKLRCLFWWSWLLFLFSVWWVFVFSCCSGDSIILHLNLDFAWLYSLWSRKTVLLICCGRARLCLCAMRI